MNLIFYHVFLNLIFSLFPTTTAKTCSGHLVLFGFSPAESAVRVCVTVGHDYCCVNIAATGKKKKKTYKGKECFSNDLSTY